MLSVQNTDCGVFLYSTAVEVLSYSLYKYPEVTVLMYLRFTVFMYQNAVNIHPHGSSRSHWVSYITVRNSPTSPMYYVLQLPGLGMVQSTQIGRCW